MKRPRSYTLFISMGMALAALPAAIPAAVPPAQIHYQGVLRGATDAPLSGTYDMEFRFYDAAGGGNEILIDRHLAANSQAVMVDGGLFAVGLGSGQVVDGSGPGTYTSLADLFPDNATVWLEVQIGAETLSPRTRVLSTGYALSAGTAESANQLNGQTSDFFLNTSSTWQLKDGSMRLQSSDAGHLPLEAIRTGGATDAAGYFENNASTGRAWLAEGNRGLRASGDEYGGAFTAPFWGSSAYAALDNTGIWANAGFRQGACAGRFRGFYDGAGYNAEIGCNGGVGVDGYGYPGGHFRATYGESGEAYLGSGNDGVLGYGLNSGGFFQDLNSSAYVYTAVGAYKVIGNGAVSFVQNHPEDAGKVIVYHAPESSEVAVYTRGTARLDKGEARVPLDRTFAWVANPEIGLTAHITPRGDPIPVSVVEVTTSEIVVRGPEGSDAAFDYFVYGLRIGFEEMSVVQAKKNESYIPSMAEDHLEYAKEPALRSYNALERFKAMESEITGAAPTGFPKAEALKAAIQEYDPAVHGPVDPAPRSARSPIPSGAHLRSVAATAQLQRAANAPDPATGAAEDGTREAAPAAPAMDVIADAVRVRASEPIEAGDLVALDAGGSGMVHRTTAQDDPAVIGVASAASMIVEGRPTVTLEHRLYGEVRADAGYGGIRAGDLLTSSPTPGHAMRTLDPRPGTVIGKALEPLEAGTGVIRMLLIAR